MSKKIYVSPIAEIVLFVPAENIAAPTLFWKFDNLVTASMTATTVGTDNWKDENTDSYKGKSTYKFP